MLYNITNVAVIWFEGFCQEPVEGVFVEISLTFFFKTNDTSYGVFYLQYPATLHRPAHI
jgi:hypothetical protein